MKKILQLALGIATSVGGFLEIGSVVTAAQAGASFGFQLLWAILLGTLCLIFLVEMSGRIAAVSKHTVVDAMREKFGFNFFVIVLVAVVLVVVMVLAAELGGIALSMQILTGIGFSWWALPVALVCWGLLWKGKLSIIENGSSLLGMVTLSLLLTAFRLHPRWSSVASDLMPSLPTHDRAGYGFIAVSILGASISPYLMYFYSSGAIEDKWDETYVPVNRAIAGLGMSFGGLLSMAVLVAAALVFRPLGISVDTFHQSALLMTTALPKWGFFLFAASMAFTCLGAVLEISLAVAYLFAQGFGWNYSENDAPARDARFTFVYTLIIVVATLPLLIGVDPVKITLVSMSLTAATLPIAVVPFLFLMNDPKYLGDHRNGWVSNTVVGFVILLAFVLSIVSIPLQIMGG